jgi:hypothetical protein
LLCSGTLCDVLRSGAQLGVPTAATNSVLVGQLVLAGKHQLRIGADATGFSRAEPGGAVGRHQSALIEQEVG